MRAPVEPGRVARIMAKFVKDKFGHSIRVPEWPSPRATAILQRHYRKKYPEVYRRWVEKGLRTAREKGDDVAVEFLLDLPKPRKRLRDAKGRFMKRERK